MANIPMTLQKQVAAVVAKSILDRCIGKELEDWWKLDHSLTNIYDKSDKRSDTRKELIHRLSTTKTWWNGERTLGAHNSELRRAVGISMMEELDLLDQNAINPLLRFTLQLCFGQKAGDLLPMPDMSRIAIHLQCDKRQCGPFNEVVKTLAPFHIEELRTDHVIFGDPTPVVSIIEASSNTLQKVHLRHNMSDFTIKHIGRHCRNITSFVLDWQIGASPVSVEYLHRTFFRNLQMAEIDQLVAKGEAVPLSFPKLKYVGMEFYKSQLPFIRNVLKFYPNLNGLSCLSKFCKAMQVPVLLHDLPVIRSIFRELRIYLSDAHLFDLESFSRALPVVSDIVIYVDFVPDKVPPEMIETVKSLVVKLHCSKLVIQSVNYSDYHGSNKFSEIFIPMFEAVGRNLTSLKILDEMVEVKTLCAILTHCTFLESLTVSKLKEMGSDSVAVKSLRLPHLSTLAFHVTSSTVLDFISHFFNAVQNLKNLSLAMSGPRLCSGNWLMQCAHAGLLRHVRTISLVMQTYYDEDLDVDFFVPFIEKLASVHTVVLHGVPKGVLLSLNMTYRFSQLEVKSGNVLQLFE
ncbi:uncharacterized protein LOC143031715 [Oratosquilla oratoria]|uniref:uncharacterized protein LOC143031715 n=1 Tax=Oratosquilla oratoria TaxID=337810 RepID=UPI003F773690